MIGRLLPGIGLTVVGHPLPIYFNPNAQGAGQVKYNTSSQELEVWDGFTWQPTSSTVTIRFATEVESLLQWAEKKRAEELRFDALSKDHPAIAAAIDAVKKAEEQLKIITILCKEEK